MSVLDLTDEERVERPGEKGVADMAMEPWHGARLHGVVEPIAHDHVGPVGKRRNETRKGTEVIRPVGIA
jgi:hypothetical protein